MNAASDAKSKNSAKKMPALDWKNESERKKSSRFARRWKSLEMSCMPFPLAILKLNWFVPSKDTSRALPTIMNPTYFTRPPRSIRFMPPKMSSLRCSCREALETPPCPRTHPRSHTSGCP